MRALGPLHVQSGLEGSNLRQFPFPEGLPEEDHAAN
jgi:hypothetical protein